MIVVGLLTLLLPGYTLARALRAPYSGAAAFPLSALLLTEIVVVFAALDAPIRVAPVLAVAGAVTLIAGIIELWRWRRGAAAVAATNDQFDTSAPRWLLGVTIIQVTLVLACLGLRSTLYPLSGFDAVFRWEALARLMLEDESLAAYPPLSAQEFDKYIYPDGIPPLVATMYWWLYACWGAPWPELTSLVIWLQAASCFALIFCGSRIAFGSTGALLSVTALAGSSLFFSSTVIGQETGFTALAYAGQLTYALVAVRRPGPWPVIAAALFAGLGALAREYGPVLSLAGGFILWGNRTTRRYLVWYFLLALMVSALWYARNWVRTGNPIYPLAPAGLKLTVNAAHSLLQQAHATRSGLRHLTAADLGHVAASIFAGAPLAIALGLLGSLVRGRRARLQLPSALIPVGLWVWSIPYTQGGLTYSLRVLAPAIVALSLAAGACGPLLLKLAAENRASARLLSFCVAAFVFAAGAYAILADAAFPQSLRQLPFALVSRGAFPRTQLGHLADLAELLEKTGLPAEGLLTDNCYLATALQRYSHFRPVMVWSPEAACVLDQRLAPSEVRRGLRGERVWYVSMAPSFEYLWMEYPLFAGDRENWLLVNGSEALQTVYFLPPLSGP